MPYRADFGPYKYFDIDELIWWVSESGGFLSMVGFRIWWVLESGGIENLVGCEISHCNIDRNAFCDNWKQNRADLESNKGSQNAPFYSFLVGFVI